VQAKCRFNIQASLIRTGAISMFNGHIRHVAQLDKYISTSALGLNESDIERWLVL